MIRGDVIRYVDMTIAEGFAVQRGMNLNLNGKDYGIILMSVRLNAPYADRFEDDGTTLIYEGHEVDQPMTLPSGVLTENGKFYNAAKLYKSGEAPIKKIKVYEKIKDGVWVYNGYFN